mgnify:FL=1
MSVMENDVRRLSKARRQVMVVDDVSTVRRVLRRSLEVLGYDVLEAESGEQAIRLYAEEGKGLHGVILDISMPGLDGRSTLRALKALDPNVSVVLASGSHEMANGPSDACGMLLKPCSLDAIESAVRLM